MNFLTNFLCCPERDGLSVR